MQFITVTALNKYVKTVLDADGIVNNVWVMGEISSFVQNASSGHCYFSLTDTQSSVRAVMFRSNASQLEFRPENGICVLARGRASLFERDGAFQLYVDEMRLYGAGDKSAHLEALKKQLNAEGIFDAAHKKSIPAFPRTIAVITSASGAALHDIINVLSRRWPCVKLLLLPVSVQGAAAEPEILDAVLSLDDLRCECAIIARGGGSKEDLDVFNSEAIVRAVYAADTPIISAVGHEIDYMLLDFVADLRAPTPSAAAELAVPDRAEYLYSAQNLFSACGSALNSRLDMLEKRSRAAMPTPADALRPAQHAAVRADAAWQAIDRSLTAKLKEYSYRTQGVFERIASISPQKVLERGYAMAQSGDRRISRAAKLNSGDRIELLFSDGSAECTVDSVKLKER